MSIHKFNRMIQNDITSFCNNPVDLMYTHNISLYISVSYMCVIILLPPQTAESVSGYMNGYGIIQLVAASRFTPAVSACVC